MSAKASLLVELVTEELPPKALKRLGEVFATGVRDGLAKRWFLDASHAFIPYMTPRRLAVLIESVPAQGAAKQDSKKLMPAKVAFDPTNRPTPALCKRLEKEGYAADVDVAALERDGRLTRREEGNEIYVFHNQTIGAQTLERALEEILTGTIDSLPIPKVMRYAGVGGYYSDVKFVRPAHRLVALHGEQVVPVTALGLQAGRESLGHRFLGQTVLSIPSADDYPRVLHEAGRIIASFEERRDAIREELLRIAGADTVIMPEALLDEVTALVEWPVVYAGNFDESFLQVPQECLILTMQQNQKYFALTDANGRMLNRFLLVSNIETADPSAIIEGNERVIRPRLADAKFFFDQDRKKTLESRLPGLDKVVYHNKLGSQGERNVRVAELAGLLARILHNAGLGEYSEENAQRAARLSKADLLTDMVGEFPELQGIMGRYYALHDGEPPEIAQAIEEHYRPRFAGDALPQSRAGICVALADKLETLVGMFGIGNIPTGDKDPFALRRHALGVLRILIEHQLPLGTLPLLRAAEDGFHGKFPQRYLGATALAEDDPLHNFLLDRLRSYLKEHGYQTNAIEAVLTTMPERLNHEILRKLDAVRAFNAMPEAQSLAAANKRIGNILKKSSEEAPVSVDTTLLTESAEASLYEMLKSVGPAAEAAFGRGDYKASLTTLAALKNPVDAFFDSVMVNVENSALRMNRLSLLRNLHGAMNRVADLSKLAA